MSEPKSVFRSEEPRDKVLGIGVFNPEITRQDKDVAADLLREIDGRPGFHNDDVSIVRETLRNYRLEILQKAGVLK